MSDVYFGPMPMPLDDPRHNWTPIPGFPGYSVSELGLVWTDKNRRLLKIRVFSADYPTVKLCNNGKCYTMCVLRLVLRSFRPNPDSSMVCGHLNNNKHDSRLENLKWITPSENVRMAWEERTGDERRPSPLVQHLDSPGEEWRLHRQAHLLVSNHGNVRHPDKPTLKPLYVRSTYLSAKGGKKRVDGEKQNFLVHRLVAECFLDNPDPVLLTVVDHKDRNRTNNHVDNLQWSDKKTNAAMACGHPVIDLLDGTTYESISEASRCTSVAAQEIQRLITCPPRFEYVTTLGKRKRSGRNLHPVLDTTSGKIYDTFAEAASETGVHPSFVGKSCKREARRWEYI